MLDFTYGAFHVMNPTKSEQIQNESDSNSEALYRGSATPWAQKRPRFSRKKGENYKNVRV